MDIDEPNILSKAGIMLNDVPIDVNARELDVPSDTRSEFPGTLAKPYKSKVEYVIVNFSRVYKEDVINSVVNLMNICYDTFGFVDFVSKKVIMGILF